MSDTQRLIRGDESRETAVRHPVPIFEAPTKAPTAEEIDQIIRSAREEGYAEGLRNGEQRAYNDTRAKVDQRISRLDQLISNISQLPEEFDDVVVTELTHLAIAIAKRLIRRELKAAPDEIIAVVREAVGLLPGVTQKLSIRVHPEDARLIREILPMHESEHGWQLIEDPTVTPGGCHIKTDTSGIDATLETRIGHIVNTVTWDERRPDEAEAGAETSP